MSDIHDPKAATLWWNAEGKDLSIVELYEAVATARRFLALTETGPEKRWCVKHDCEGLGNADRGEIGCTGAGVGRAVDMDCRLIPVLVIPVSDGGSET